MRMVKILDKQHQFLHQLCNHKMSDVEFADAYGESFRRAQPLPPAIPQQGTRHTRCNRTSNDLVGYITERLLAANTVAFAGIGEFAPGRTVSEAPPVRATREISLVDAFLRNTGTTGR